MSVPNSSISSLNGAAIGGVACFETSAQLTVTVADASGSDVEATNYSPALAPGTQSTSVRPQSLAMRAVMNR